MKEATGESTGSSARLDKERRSLIESLQGPGEPGPLKQRVVRMLSRFPEARNDDDELWERLVRTYAPQEVDEEGRVHLSSFKALPRRYDAQRARAHIQNSLGLFLASPEIEEARRKRAEEEGARYSPRNLKAERLFVFCDESQKTKTDRYLTVGSVWVRSQEDRDAIQGYLGDWRHRSGAGTDEFHLSKLKSSERLDRYVEFFETIQERSDVVAFRAVVLDQQNVRCSTEDMVREAHRHLLQRSVEFDLERRRLTPGRQLVVYKDSDGADHLAVENLRNQIRADLRDYHHGSFVLTDLQALDSKDSDLIQVADLFAGAVARAWRRVEDPGEGPQKNAKEEFTNVLCKRLGLARCRPTTRDSGEDFVMVWQLG